jgi:DHA2 family multidrug resistance protein
MGFGMGFIFVPLTTLSVSTLRDDQIGSATGIQNLMRNVGGSIGISWLSTMLARYAQVHQAFLVGHVSSLDPAYRMRLGVMKRVFAAHFNPVDALRRAQDSVYNTVIEQANYWAYIDAFYMLMWACGLCLLAATLFQNVKSPRAVAMH